MGTIKTASWLWYMYIPDYFEMRDSREKNMRAKLVRMENERIKTLTALINSTKVEEMKRISPRVVMGKETAKKLLHHINKHIQKIHDLAPGLFADKINRK